MSLPFSDPAHIKKTHPFFLHICISNYIIMKIFNIYSRFNRIEILMCVYNLLLKNVENPLSKQTALECQGWHWGTVTNKWNLKLWNLENCIHWFFFSLLEQNTNNTNFTILMMQVCSSEISVDICLLVHPNSLQLADLKLCPHHATVLLHNPDPPGLGSPSSGL